MPQIPVLNTSMLHSLYHADEQVDVLTATRLERDPSTATSAGNQRSADG